jgi:RNA polymerase sigma factor (TIGR02999 family)
MSGAPAEDVTQLLLDPQLASAERAERLLPLVYEHLRGIARQRMAAERLDHTLQPTALVHEAYLRLVGERELPWQNRAHFFAAAAEAMRRILLDHAKARGRVKRGGGAERVPLSVGDLVAAEDPAEILSLDEALCRLTECDPGIGDVVRLRFYAGLSIEETARTLEISQATVKRRWEFGRTWLYHELTRNRQVE